MMNCECLLDVNEEASFRWQPRGDGTYHGLCTICGLWMGVESGEPQVHNRIEGLIQDIYSPPVYHTLRHFRLDLVGQAAMTCDGCGELTFWQGSKPDMEIFCYRSLAYGIVPCPRCGCQNRVTPDWAEMLR